jgi:hypothetical protein
LISQLRTNERHQEFNGQFGYITGRQPLINIDFNKKPSDKLHLVARIKDQLFIKMFNDMLRLDRAHNHTRFVARRHVNVSKLINLIITRTSFNFNPEGLSCETIKNYFTSMIGNRRDQIFSQIDISVEFQVELGPNRANQVGWLWETFNQFCEDLPYYKDHIQAIRQRNPEANLTEIQARMIYADELEARNKHWCKVFTHVYSAADVTPYIHRFAIHLADIYRRYGDAFLFHNEGFEQSHRVAKLRYEHSNNKIRRVGTARFLKPLLQKTLRCSYLQKRLRYTYSRKGKRSMKNNIQRRNFI